MTKRLSVLAVVVLAVLSVVAAEKKTYKYKCTKSGQIFEFSMPGSHKCPEHKNHTLIRVFEKK